MARIPETPDEHTSFHNIEVLKYSIVIIVGMVLFSINNISYENGDSSEFGSCTIFRHKEGFRDNIMHVRRPSAKRGEAASKDI